MSKELCCVCSNGVNPFRHHSPECVEIEEAATPFDIVRGEGTLYICNACAEFDKFCAWCGRSFGRKEANDKPVALPPGCQTINFDVWRRVKARPGKKKAKQGKGAEPTGGFVPASTSSVHAGCAGNVRKAVSAAAKPAGPGAAPPAADEDTPASKKPRRRTKAPLPSLCTLTVDTRTKTATQLDQEVTKSELRVAHAIVSRLLHQNSGSVDKKGTIQLNSGAGGQHLWFQKMTIHKKEGENVPFHSKSITAEINQTAKVLSPPGKAAGDVLAVAAQSSLAKAAGVRVAGDGGEVDLEETAVRLGLSGNQTRRLVKLQRGKVRWTQTFQQQQDAKLKRRLGVVYSREDVTRDKDGKTMELGFMRHENICDLIAERWSTLLAHPSVIALHKEGASTWTLMYDLGGKEMKFAMQVMHFVINIYTAITGSVLIGVECFDAATGCYRPRVDVLDNSDCKGSFHSAEQIPNGQAEARCVRGHGCDIEFQNGANVGEHQNPAGEPRAGS
jgi:hypothetical protein